MADSDDSPRVDPDDDADDSLPPGRPPTYQADFARQAGKLAKLGATDYELADFFGVTTRTVQRWKVQHPSFCRAVKTGGAPVDERVKRSLFNRAVGYTFESEKVFQFEGAIVRAKTIEHVPPDVSAAMHWLRNRKPADWNQQAKVEHSGQVGLIQLVEGSPDADV